MMIVSDNGIGCKLLDTIECYMVGVVHRCDLLALDSTTLVARDPGRTAR